MITRWRWMGLVVGLLVVCPALASAEEGLPNQETLKAMGLSGMQVMSDTEALAIRGQGVRFSRVRGNAFARIGDETTPVEGDNDAHYRAKGKYYAAGGSHGSVSKLVIDGTVVFVGQGPVDFNPGILSGLDVDLDVKYTKVSSSGGSWARSF